MSAAVGAILKLGLSSPVCVGVHAIFCNGAEETLSRAQVARTITCNTISHPTNDIDVLDTLASAVARYLKSAMNERSSRGLS